MLLNIRATFTNNFVPKNFQKSSIWSHCGHSSRLHLPSNPHTLSISLVLVSVKVNEERMLLVACSMDVVETWCLSRESPSSPSLSLLHPPTLSLFLSHTHTLDPPYLSLSLSLSCVCGLKRFDFNLSFMSNLFRMWLLLSAWPDWAIYSTFGNISKPLATIYFAKNSYILRQFL